MSSHNTVKAHKKAFANMFEWWMEWNVGFHLINAITVLCLASNKVYNKICTYVGVFSVVHIQRCFCYFSLARTLHCHSHSVTSITIYIAVCVHISMCYLKVKGILSTKRADKHSIGSKRHAQPMQCHTKNSPYLYDSIVANTIWVIV